MATDGESVTMSYDEKNDIFVLQKDFTKDETFKGNLDAGDLVLDISSKGNIRGIEIINATHFLREFGITPEMMRSASKGNFTAQVRTNGITICITLMADQQIHPAIIVVPQEIPGRDRAERNHNL